MCDYGCNDEHLPLFLSITISAPLSYAPLSSCHSVPMTVKANASISVYEGDPLQVYCEARGNPKPTVVLYREIGHQAIYGFNQVKEFFTAKARLYHAGRFLCFATQYSFYIPELQPTPTSIVTSMTISVTVLGKCIMWTLCVIHNESSFWAPYSVT